MRPIVVALAAALAILLVVGGALAWRAVDDGTKPALKGSGTVVTEARQVSGFERVELKGAGVLRITQGAAESLSITTDDNILPVLTTTVRDGTLTLAVDTSDHGGIDPTALTYELGVQTLTALSVAGAASVEGNPLAADALRVEVDGASQVTWTGLQVTTLTITSDGESTFTLAGTADAQRVEIAGAGDYRAADLASRTASIHIEGTAHAALRVAETLDVSIDGAGVVEYAGSPAVTQQVKGAGVVRQASP